MRVLDLFCGAGIGAIGLKSSGFDIVQAIDNNPHAISTYNKNIGDHAILADITELDYNTIPDIDMIAGGVPCLPFSFAGKGKGTDDEEHGNLIYNFFNVVKHKKPTWVIFENVRGIISEKHKHVFHEFVNNLESIGYYVNWKLTDCIEYGIPQKRERVIIVASLKNGYAFPKPTHTIPVTIRETIGDLPEPNEKHEFKNHYGYGIRNDELPFVDKIPIGGNWKDLPIEDQKIFLGGAFGGGGGQTGFLKKISFDKPALTITSTMNGKFNAQIVDLQDKYQNGSKVGCRRFTVRECLRLQTVPDWFYFDDDVPLAKQYERCSGIPPVLMERICENIVAVDSGAFFVDNVRLTDCFGF